MNVIPTKLPGVVIIEPRVFEDGRGFFMETWHQEKYANEQLNLNFVQDNHSRSCRGVLRGLHYQLEKPQGKLVRVATGAVYDVAVDIRLGSPTFAQWVGVELSESNFRQMYIPPGFAHGFLTLSETADFIYKCTDYYHPESEHGVLWSDPAIGIEWPELDYVISDKDIANKALSEMSSLLPKYESGS